MNNISKGHKENDSARLLSKSLPLSIKEDKQPGMREHLYALLSGHSKPNGTNIKGIEQQYEFMASDASNEATCKKQPKTIRKGMKDAGSNAKCTELRIALVILPFLIISLVIIGTIVVDWDNTTYAECETSGYCGVDGDNLTWSINSDGKLTISGIGQMADMKKSWDCQNRNWGGNTVKSIIIEEGVTSIGGYAFEWCKSLRSVSIPDSVRYIGDEAFGGCEVLTHIEIPDSVRNIGIRAFWESGLTSINIPANVKIIELQAFSNCDGLISVNLPNGLEKINEYAFWQSDLTSIIIPESVKWIGKYAFGTCNKLTSINIPYGIQSIEENTFSHCNLTSARRIDFDSIR